MSNTCSSRTGEARRFSGNGAVDSGWATIFTTDRALPDPSWQGMNGLDPAPGTGKSVHNPGTVSSIAEKKEGQAGYLPLCHPMRSQLCLSRMTTVNPITGITSY